jgi:hypothetical protein
MGGDADRIALEEEAAWIELHATFDVIPPERFEEPQLTPDGWSAKDAMFHVAAWCAEAAQQLERMRVGTYIDPVIETDVQNRAWFEISRELDVSTVKAEIHAARTKMRQEWCELGEHGEMTRDAIEWFEESGHIHYRDHRRELLAWLDRI